MTKEVLVRNSDGSYDMQPLADAGAVAAAASGGLDLTAGELSLAANTDGKGLTNTSGVLAVSIPGRGAKTAITTAGAGTLTAAGIVAGLIVRSGPTGAYNDTTATAAAIVALLKDPAIGDSFEFTIINSVAYIETMVAGDGVTLAGTTANAASKVRRYHCQVTAIDTPAVTITGIGELAA